MYGAKVLTPQKTIFWIFSWKIGNLHLRILYLFSLNLRKYHFDSGNFFSSLDKSPVGLNKGEVCKKWVIFTADLEQKEAIFASSESPVKNVICSYVSLKQKCEHMFCFYINRDYHHLSCLLYGFIRIQYKGEEHWTCWIDIEEVAAVA